MVKKALISNKSFNSIYSQIKEIIESSKSSAYKAVNFVKVQSYWLIGQVIVEYEQKGKTRAVYGSELIKQLSSKLQNEYGEGYNSTNLKYSRQFYLTFQKSHALRDQSVPGKSHAAGDKLSLVKVNNKTVKITTELSPLLSWTHYRLLLKIAKEEVRNFYIKECIENNWGTRELERQINSHYYERLISSKNKNLVSKESKKNIEKYKPSDVIKDPYVLEFLGLKENTAYLEKDLEQALIDKLQDFLLELGKGFSFVARQKRITVDGDHFYIDLVFYNYILKCFCLIDLKIGKLTHQDIGQMDFYVRYFEEEIKNEDDNPTIGLILCSDKNDTMVKYTLLKKSKNIFASKYMLYLPTEDELKKEIEKEREIIETEKNLLN